MKLYEIEYELSILIDQMNSSGNDDEYTIQAITELEMAREKKLLDIACVIKGMKADAEAIRNEEKALAARRKVIENQVDRLTGLVSNTLKPDEKLSDPRATVKYHHTPHLIIECPVNELPIEFQRTITRQEPDKMAIKKALELGITVENARLERSVVIG